MVELHVRRRKKPADLFSTRAQLGSETSKPRHAFFYRFGWMPLFPLVLLATALLKIKNRKLANDDGYLDHQIDFFSFFNEFQRKLGLEDLIGTDKFHQLRSILTDYAFYEKDGEHLTVLDVATGYGFQAKALKEAGAKKVFGIDIVPERIRGAKYLHGEDEIVFKIMDAANMQFPDNYFDCTIVSAALHDIPNCTRRRVLSEMIRVTRHRGNIVIMEPRTFKNRLLGFVLGTIGELIDESLNMRDFVMDDLNTILMERKLEIVKDVNVRRVLNVKLCRVTKMTKEANQPAKVPNGIEHTMESLDQLALP